MTRGDTTRSRGIIDKIKSVYSDVYLCQLGPNVHLFDSESLQLIDFSVTVVLRFGRKS